MTGSRRSFLARLLAAAALPGVAHAEHASEQAAIAVLSGARDGGGRFRAAGLRADLHEALGLTTPLRLHAVVPMPGGGAVAIARRPGDLAFVLDPRLEEPLILRAAPGRCFAGHGVFLEGGTLFAIAEIDVRTGEGAMALLDVAAGYRRRTEFATAGIGPHEMIGLAARTLVVANGAREPNTDPSLEALVTTAARSNLGFLDPATGALTLSLEAGADFDGVSLRHMAADGAGGVVVAAQESEPGIADRPLLFAATERGIEPFEGSEAVWLSLKGYLGSLAVDRAGRFALCSSPRGGIAWAFDLRTRRPVGSVALADVCGVAADGLAGGFIATTGLGTIARLRIEDGRIGIVEQRSSAVAFDNHLFVRA